MCIEVCIRAASIKANNAKHNKKSRLTGKTRGRFAVLLISSQAACFASRLSCSDPNFNTHLILCDYCTVLTTIVRAPYIVLFDLKPLNKMCICSALAIPTCVISMKLCRYTETFLLLKHISIPFQWSANTAILV